MDEINKEGKVVDARDILCPGPFWELIKTYTEAHQNETITLLATEALDSDTKKDAPYWIRKSGNELLGVRDREGFYEISMRKINPGRQSS